MIRTLCMLSHDAMSHAGKPGRDVCRTAPADAALAGYLPAAFPPVHHPIDWRI